VEQSAVDENHCLIKSIMLRNEKQTADPDRLGVRIPPRGLYIHFSLNYNKMTSFHWIQHGCNQKLLIEND